MEWIYCQIAPLGWVPRWAALPLELEPFFCRRRFLPAERSVCALISAAPSADAPG